MNVWKNMGCFGWFLLKGYLFMESWWLVCYVSEIKMGFILLKLVWILWKSRFIIVLYWCWKGMNCFLVLFIFWIIWIFLIWLKCSSWLLKSRLKNGWMVGKKYCGIVKSDVMRYLIVLFMCWWCCVLVFFVGSWILVCCWWVCRKRMV